MSERIISIGFQVPGGKIESALYSERISLLDWDIALMTTDLTNSIYHGTATYNGKRCLSDNSSFEYSESQNYWKKAISEAVNNGKAVILFLDDYEEVYIATGERTYSGSGRNQQTTRFVANTNNYNIIPHISNIWASIGTQICLNPKYQYLNEYWTQFASQSKFKVTFESDFFVPLLTTKTGNKTVGGIYINNNSGGYLLLLPSIDFDNDVFIRTRENKKYWSKIGVEFGGTFLSSIISINKNIKALSAKTSQPDWIHDQKYVLDKEIDILSQMSDKEKKLSKIQSEIQQLKESLSQEVSIKDLLYEHGKPLEYAIMKALEIIGFSVSHYKENDSEFDVVFECSEGRFIGEIEGKDNKPINIDKLRQLEMNVNEDFEREEVNAIAKGVLFGNAYRLHRIEDRKDSFTEKCMIASERSNVALVKAQDLYFLCQNIENLSEDDKSKIRQLLFETKGLVDFSCYFRKSITMLDKESE